MTAALVLALAAGLGAGAPGREAALARAIAFADPAATERILAAGPLDLAAEVDADGARVPLVRLAVEVAAGHRSDVDLAGERGPRLAAGDPRALAVLRRLFSAGADANFSWRVSGGRSSSYTTYYLVERAVGESAGALDVLRAAGLDPKSPGVGEALVTASERGLTAVVRRLVEAGANVNHAQRKTGRTPLSEAVHRRRLEVIGILERAGAREWVE
jgi:hypothetical protein